MDSAPGDPLDASFVREDRWGSLLLVGGWIAATRSVAGALAAARPQALIMEAVAEEMMEVAHEWVEVNIVPSLVEQRKRLLIEVIDPLVHDKLDGRVETWFYFWEVDPISRLHLRLRVRWQRPTQAVEEREQLFAWLDGVQREGKLATWYEGSHGEKGKVYLAEAAAYGAEMWELTSKDWMSGSELALALLKLESEKGLTQPLPFHWERRVHLYSNQLGLSYLDEGHLSLRQAYGYLARGNHQDPRVANIMAAIERYFKDQA